MQGSHHQHTDIGEENEGKTGFITAAVQGLPMTSLERALRPRQGRRVDEECPSIIVQASPVCVPGCKGARLGQSSKIYWI